MTVRLMTCLFLCGEVSCSGYSSLIEERRAESPSPPIFLLMGGQQGRRFCSTRYSALQPAYDVQWVGAGRSAKVLVRGLTRSNADALLNKPPDSERWKRILSVFAANQTTPMTGSYRVADRGIEFTPGFPLTPGLRYRAVCHPSELSQVGHSPPITSSFSLPRRTNASTFVARVFPTADTLPENLLKFYIHFSGPMRRGGIYSHMQLIDQNGKHVDLPFLEIDEELWNPEMTRVTLFIDPGRIKRGVKPLEDIGPALESGRRYTLSISREWRDAHGNPLRTGFRKPFRVAAADRNPLSPTNWNIVAPRPGTRKPVVVNMGESVDHALAQRLIWIERNSRRIPGSVTLSRNEQVLNLTPSSAWRAGQHSLAVATRLEDLAGNNVGKPFEVDVFKEVQRGLTSETVRVPFRIR